MLSPSLNLLVPFLGAAAAGALKAAGKGVAVARNPTEMRKTVDKMLAELDCPVVVLIDELDRVENAEVRTVAQLVRSVLDFPKVSYLLAYDPRRVAEALGDGARSAARPISRRSSSCAWRCRPRHRRRSGACSRLTSAR
jgi:predicted KAP-like P-loop ATPase